MSVRILNLSSLAMAGVALGALGAGIVTGSAGVFAGAILCALILALLQGLALSREFGDRFDAILDRARLPHDNAGGR